MGFIIESLLVLSHWREGGGGSSSEMLFMLKSERQLHRIRQLHTLAFKENLLHEIKFFLTIRKLGPREGSAIYGTNYQNTIYLHFSNSVQNY